MTQESLEQLKMILSNLREGDWFEDENGCLWEWGYDIVANLSRWFETDTYIVGPMARGQETSFDIPDMSMWAWDGNNALRRVKSGEVYRVVNIGD